MCRTYDDSLIKAPAVHMILFIVVTWREVDDSIPEPPLFFFFFAESTTKNSSYTIFFPALSKTAVIGQPIPIAVLLETIGIGRPITAGQSLCFQNCYYRSPIAAVFEIDCIGGPITVFHKRHYMAKFSTFFFFFCKQPIMTVLKLPL